MTYDYSEIVPFLLHWYERNARILRWREEPKPYYVWVSEIMLQQTRVEAVKPYYTRFLEKYKNIEVHHVSAKEFDHGRTRKRAVEYSNADIFVCMTQDALPANEQLIEKLLAFKGVPQELQLPSAPKQFIQYLEEDNRPQVQLDVNYENGMGVSVGRIREDKVYDFKFVGLSHNTVRGAAGGAVLCAELLKAQGFITKK